MKKLLALALSAAIVACPFTAYAAQTVEGVAVYQEMLTQSESLNDIHAYYDMTVGMTGNVLDGSDINMRLEMELRMTNANDLSQMRFQGYARMSLLGEQTDVSMYYANDWLYVESAGEKVKTELPLSLMQSTYDTTQGYASLLNSVSFMQDLTVSHDGENRILSYRMDDAKLNQLIQAVLQTSGYSEAMNGMTMTVSDVYGEYVVLPNGYYSNATIHMQMDMAYEGETVTLKLDGTIGIPNPGEAVEIQTPDLSGYTAA